MTNNSNSNPQRRGTTVAGLGGLALASVLLLCGAGNAPIENFTPQGAMQADLNAGGHSVTNVATVSATNVTVSGALTATNFTLPFASVTAKPTTVAGYGITDAETQAASDARYSPLAGSTNLTTLGTVTAGSFPYARLSGNPLSIATGKTLTASNTLTLAGTDGSTLNVGAGGTLGGEAFDASAPTGAAAGQTVATTQTYTLARAGHSTSLQVTLQAGTGAYTANIALSDTGCLTGDLAFVNVAWPASTNPTLKFYDGSTSGTLLAGPLSGTAMGGASTFQFEFNGTGWTHFSKGELDTRNLGTGVQTALGNAANAAGGPVVATSAGMLPTLTQVPPNSIVIIIGESYAMGVPINAIGAHQNAASYTGPGKCWPQWLSALPPFANIPVYSYGLSGSDSSSGAGVLATATYGATEYLNGSVVGSYSGITATPSALISAMAAGGTCYFGNTYDGDNDYQDSLSLASYESNMTALFATERGYGSNVKVIGFTSPATVRTPLQLCDPYNRWIRSELGVSGGLDYVVDVSPSFPDPTNAFYQTDYTHLTSQGYYQYALLVENTLLATTPNRPFTSSEPVCYQFGNDINMLSVGGTQGFLNLYNAGTGAALGFHAGASYSHWSYTTSAGSFKRGYLSGAAQSGSSAGLTAWESLTSSGETYAVPVFAGSGIYNAAGTYSFSASYTVPLGFSVFTGSTASQTGTLPTPSAAGAEIIHKNQASVAETLSLASHIIASGATATSSTLSVASGAMVRLWWDGTNWNQQ